MVLAEISHINQSHERKNPQFPHPRSRLTAYLSGHCMHTSSHSLLSQMGGTKPAILLRKQLLEKPRLNRPNPKSSSSLRIKSPQIHRTNPCLKHIHQRAWPKSNALYLHLRIVPSLNSRRRFLMPPAPTGSKFGKFNLPQTMGLPTIHL